MDIKTEAVQVRHRNKMEKKFLQLFPLSRLLAKTPRVNKPAMEKFLKVLPFSADVNLWAPPLTYKIATHNINGMRN